ncbi:MAG: hypothetical protein IKG47_07670 [Oscillospiraceae bacterium]|nr:hypothetical protein [Oscillospiraceae bacterium]
MREHIRTICSCMALLLIASLLGYILIVAVYMLPDKFIVYNASLSTDFLVKNYIEKDTVWMNWPDYFTDVVMLNIASFNGGEKTAFQRAIENEKIGNTFEIVRWLSERTQIQKAFYVYEDESAYYEITAYGKYWNGYLVFLRPLLLYFSMNQIYQIFEILMIISFIGTVIALLVRRPSFAIPFICSFFTLRPFSKFCLTYAIINILLCAFLSISITSKKIQKNKKVRMLFFFAMGCITCYFTLMGYTFVIALFSAVYLVFSISNLEDGSSSKLMLLIEMLAYYAFGYVAMWAAKWAILLVFSSNLLADVYNSILIRLSHEDSGQKVTLSNALLWNACGFYYKNNGLFISFLIGAIEIIVIAILSFSQKRRLKAILYLDDLWAIAGTVVAVILRYAVVLNHSKVHYFFMNRLMSGIIFVILSYGIALIERTIHKMK